MEKGKVRGLLGRIDINAPVTLGLTAVSLVLLCLNALLGGALNRIFAAYFTAYTDIWMYPRLLTHVLMHQDMAHFSSNFIMILTIGPMVEEKYGSRRLLAMMAACALVTGLIHVIFSRGTMLLGASGIVFMLILLASFANIRAGKLPLTVLLVGTLYIGNEVVAGLASRDAVSHVSHIAGGLCGAAFGFRYKGETKVKT